MARQGQKTKTLVKVRRSRIFDIHHDPRHGQRVAGLHHLLAGVCQQDAAQSGPLKLHIHRQPRLRLDHFG